MKLSLSKALAFGIVLFGLAQPCEATRRGMDLGGADAFDRLPQREHSQILGERLVRAAARGALGEVGKLIERGAYIDFVNAQGNCALQLAIVGGHEQVVRLLLVHDAFLFHKNQAGDTPMRMAENSANPEISRMMRAAVAAQRPVLDFDNPVLDFDN